MKISLDTLFQEMKFTPNAKQRKAIEHVNGPLFLVAGPGSGKTRVLLWRTVNLIVFHGVKPEEIFLSTFTEKAAKQLKEGLLTLLGLVTNKTGVPYDISQMYVGTVHSLCQRFPTDRRFTQAGRRRRAAVLLDGLDQYFHLHNNGFWNNAKQQLTLPDDIFRTINKYFDNRASESKHKAVENCISLFNRFSEENLDPQKITKSKNDRELKLLAKIYKYYMESLNNGTRRFVDFSLLQQEGYNIIKSNPATSRIFKHIIIDEYQDTNSIQEKIFFKLASGHSNICVVGDDDQALYRFRGATVENFVLFPNKCEKLKKKTKTINLSTNYRSRKKIVDFYCRFIELENWVKNEKKKEFYRVMDKKIQAHSQDTSSSVIATSPGNSYHVCEEIADLVTKLIQKKKVNDPNQIAFLYPSLKSVHVGRMIDALEQRGLKVYAPRANKFLDNEEPSAIFGLFIKVFGKPDRNPQFDFGENKAFHDWLDKCKDKAERIIDRDKMLAKFISDKRKEVNRAQKDYHILASLIDSKKWDINDEYIPDHHKNVLFKANDLSKPAQNDLKSKRLNSAFEKSKTEGKPWSLGRVVNRITTLDWNVLDLFYRLCGFNHFKGMFHLAEQGTDEGPICNLSLTSRYLARFIDNYYSLVGGPSLINDKFQRMFFTVFLGALFRKGQTEYEDNEDVFPKGRIPFLTIHQAKGLEFPVVILGNPSKPQNEPQRTEELVRPFLTGDLEPLDKVPVFDAMRMFYVALSRAQNLLIVAHLKGRGLSIHPHFKTLLKNPAFPRLPKFNFKMLPKPDSNTDDLCRVYSYTSDYLSYQDCPRRYMIFRKYGFEPSRSTTMFFGSLVHQTIEDLHHLLIQIRGQD